MTTTHGDRTCHNQPSVTSAQATEHSAGSPLNCSADVSHGTPKSTPTAPDSLTSTGPVSPTTETSPPSTGRPWNPSTSSPPVFLANRGPTLDLGKVLATLATCGPPSRAPFAHYDPDSSCWRTCAGSFTEESGEPMTTWPASVTTSGGFAYRLRQRAPRTAGNGGSASPGTLMPTPRAQNGEPRNQNVWRRPDGQPVNLENALALLPTPQARDGDANSRGASHPDRRKELCSKRGGQLDEVAVHLPPTPTAADGVGGPGARVHGDNLKTTAALLPTPLARDGQGRGEGHPDRHGNKGPHLGEVARHQLMPTPRAGDGDKGGPDQRGSSGDPMLPSAVQPERWGRYGDAITRWEHTLGQPAPNPTEPGTKGQPRLAPAFSEWLMGLPAGHLTNHLSRNAALKAAGNGVVPQQVTHAVTVLLADITNILEADREAA